MSKGIVTAILVLVLIGTLLFSKPVSTECRSQTNQISTHLMTAYQNVTTHEGDLIINGTRTFVIENCTYRVTGSIYVKDQSNLVVKNALLIIDANYSDQNWISVQDFAKLRMENTTDSQYYQIRASNHAQLDIIDSKIINGDFHFDQDSRIYINKSTVPQMWMWSQSEVVILDSEILWTLGICFSDPSQVAQLEGLRPGFYKCWNLHGNQTLINVEHDLTIENSSVNSWSVEIGQHPKVTISNSSIERMGCMFQDAKVAIGGARLGFYSNWTLDKLTLLNTSVTGHWLLGFDNSRAEITNTTALIDLGERNSILCRDSTLGWLKGGGVNNQIQFQRTKIEMIICYFSGFYVQGEIEFPPEAYVSEWVSSNITRNYDVTAKDMDGNSMKNVEMNLFDRDKTLLWNGHTNSLGRADFNLTFVDNNYTDIMKVEAFKEGFYNTSQYVKFLSNTPISFVLVEKPLGDINEDRTVNIVDVTLVASSFGCVPGDGKWNELCDLNNDYMINIVDISMVAIDYGKIV